MSLCFIIHVLKVGPDLIIDSTLYRLSPLPQSQASGRRAEAEVVKLWTPESRDQSRWVRHFKCDRLFQTSPWERAVEDRPVNVGTSSGRDSLLDDLIKSTRANTRGQHDVWVRIYWRIEVALDPRAAEHEALRSEITRVAPPHLSSSLEGLSGYLAFSH